MFGAIYFIVPRVTNCEWLTGKRIRRHFWLSAYACIFLCVLLLVAGFSQGAANDSWGKDYWSGILFSRGYLVGRILMWLFLLAANVNFLRHLSLMVLNRGRKAGAPTLIHERPAPVAPPVATLPIPTEGAEA
jgi:cytochrome c oxidase cbb3-type subunit I